MNDNTTPPVHQYESLWKAINWLSEKGEISQKLIEEASMRYNLSPKDEEFLMRHFKKGQ